ncbi:MAG: hypothetical protein K5840_04695 [Eubacterium sp.]|nr:hypothetical protein [Eubacterium sp.]
MLNIEVLATVIVFLASLAAFIYGVVTILIRKKALYLKMIVLAVACILISRLYLVLQYLTRGEIPDGFHVGILGGVGCFLFLLSSNYGQMDSLADDGSAQFAKYRLISWLAPVVLIIVYIPTFMAGGTLDKVVGYTVAMVFVVISARFHLKHLIFPDVDYGIIKCIRGYNALALLLCLAVTVTFMSEVNSFTYLYLAANIVIAGCCVAILPVLRKEAAKWTI